MKKKLRLLAKFYLASLFLVLLLSFLFFKNLGLEQNVNAILEGCSWAHPFGTDSLGRDLLQRIIQGGQISVAIGLLTTFLAFLIGLVYGALAGWCEGIVDKVLMRLVDVWMSIPSFVSVAVLCLGFEYLLKINDPQIKSFVGLTLGISLTHWMSLARVARGLVMETKRSSFIEAAKTLGARPEHILYRHVFPNIRGRLLILAAMQIPTNIMYESYMSFIGLGIQPPWTSWGVLLQEGWKTLAAFPHLILFPSMVLFITMWSLNLVLEQD